MPVTREPTAAITEPARGRGAPLPQVLGERVEHDPEAVHVGPDPARPVDDRDPAAVLAGPDMPVTARTGSATVAASCAQFRDHRLASARLTWGPGRAQRTPVEMATSQSIICPLLTPPPYVVAAVVRYGPGATGATPPETPPDRSLRGPPGEPLRAPRRAPRPAAVRAATPATRQAERPGRWAGRERRAVARAGAAEA